jgi:hypothetical protein
MTAGAKIAVALLGAFHVLQPLLAVIASISAGFVKYDKRCSIVIRRLITVARQPRQTSGKRESRPA